MKALNEKVMQAVRQQDVAGGTLVFEDIAANLLLSVRTPFSTLMVSSFNNYVPKTELIERLLLYGKIFSWDEKVMLEFMLPAEWLKTMYEQNDFVFSDATFHKGFGYWLVWHRNKVTGEKLKEYTDYLLMRYRVLDLDQGKQRFNVVGIIPGT
jgi:hypothetical protein